MDFEPVDMNTSKYYFDNETGFITTRNFFTNDLNILYRKNAVSEIAKVSKKDDPDAYVPYVAMNYFDRFICRCDMKHVEGQTDTEKIRLIAISCFTLSAKMRTKSFSVEQFLIDLNRDMNLSITHPSVMKMERLIKEKLDSKMSSITAFSFLNHYYALFEPLGGFKRRSINQIIVEAQGLYALADLMPSEIALAAFAAAASISYPKKKIPEDIRKMMSSQVENCLNMMVSIGNNRKIKFDTSGSSEEIEEDGTALIDKRRQHTGKTETSQLQIKEKPEQLFDKKDVAAEETDAEKRSLAKGKDRGKAVEKVKEPQLQMEGSISEKEPKKFMNFELNWDTDAPSLEVGTGQSTVFPRNNKKKMKEIVFTEYQNKLFVKAVTEHGKKWTKIVETTAVFRKLGITANSLGKKWARLEQQNDCLKNLDKDSDIPLQFVVTDADQKTEEMLNKNIDLITISERLEGMESKLNTIENQQNEMLLTVGKIFDLLKQNFPDKPSGSSQTPRADKPEFVPTKRQRQHSGKG